MGELRCVRRRHLQAPLLLLTLGRRWRRVSCCTTVLATGSWISRVRGLKNTRQGRRGTWDRNILAHAQHPVDLGDTKPVQDVRHQGLEAHVLHTGDILSPLEVVGCPIFATLSSVVHDYENYQNLICKTSRERVVDRD